MKVRCAGCLSEAKQLAFEDLFDRYRSEGMESKCAESKALSDAEAEAAYYVDAGYVDCRDSHESF